MSETESITFQVIVMALIVVAACVPMVLEWRRER